MVLPTPQASKYARLHVRRRSLMFDRIGWLCADCGASANRPNFLHVDHRNPADKVHLNTKQELARLLTLPLATLRATVQPLCPACHDRKSRLNGDYAFTRRAA